ncbi:MAG: hypothetical protein ACRDGE_00300 [Candidatus Limnocylindria bacterium]
MKRSVGGGAHRGPVGVQRQRRTIRFVQVLLVLIAAGLLVFAGYSWGKADGFERGRSAADVDAPSKPSVVQTAALVLLGAAALGGAVALQGPGGVRVPSPARLEELAGRAEEASAERS